MNRILFQSSGLHKISYLTSLPGQSILQQHAKYSPVRHYLASSIGKLLLGSSVLIWIWRSFLPPALPSMPTASKLTPWAGRCKLPSPWPGSPQRPGSPRPPGQGQPAAPLWQSAGAAQPFALPCRPAHRTQPESLLLPPRENGLLTTGAGQDGGSHRSRELQRWDEVTQVELSEFGVPASLTHCQPISYLFTRTVLQHQFLQIPHLPFLLVPI